MLNVLNIRGEVESYDDERSKFSQVVNDGSETLTACESDSTK